jgi:hypothetical protein
VPPRRLAAVPAKPPRERAPDLRDAVRAAVDAMDWLSHSDHALRTLALRQAEEIEKAVDRAEELEALWAETRADDRSTVRRLEKLEAMCDVTKTVGWLGVQLQGVLRDLGGTPAARAAFSKDKPVGSRLEQLRNAAGKHDT